MPIVGGKTFYSPCYNDNPLVNAFSAGFVRLDKMASSQTAKPGDYAVLLGSKTGRDGIAGASFASRELDEDSKASKPQIQIGDPFEEKLLIECCMDLLDKKLIASMQDMGAAGILSSSSEIAHKSGCGIDIQVEKIPLREADMLPWEIFLSESQERMLLIVEEEKLEPVFAMAKHYGLDCAIVGEMTDSWRRSCRLRYWEIRRRSSGPPPSRRTCPRGRPLNFQSWRAPIPRRIFSRCSPAPTDTARTRSGSSTTRWYSFTR